MIIDSQTLDYYGLTLLKLNGPLDMPSRLGDTTYDWGDEIEPLVHENDLFWQVNHVSCEFLFKPTQELSEQQLMLKFRSLLYQEAFQVNNETFKQRVIDNGGIVVLDDISSAIQFEVYSDSFYNSSSLLSDTDNGFLIETKYGNTRVKLKSFTRVKKYLNEVVYKSIFQELKPNYSSVVLGQQNNSGNYQIDGYGLDSYFGFIVSSIKGLNDVNHKSLDYTNYNIGKDLSIFKKHRVVSIECNKIFSDANELKSKMDELRKILSSSGLRSLKIKGNEYSAYLTEGFKVKVSSRRARFVLKLNIV